MKNSSIRHYLKITKAPNIYFLVFYCSLTIFSWSKPTTVKDFLCEYIISGWKYLLLRVFIWNWNILLFLGRTKGASSQTINLLLMYYQYSLRLFPFRTEILTNSLFFKYYNLHTTKKEKNNLIAFFMFSLGYIFYKLCNRGLLLRMLNIYVYNYQF